MYCRLSYLLLTGASITHVVALCSDANRDAALEFSVRFLVLGLITSWLKLLKLARAFRSFGPFVLMLGHMIGDVMKFVFLFVDLLVRVSRCGSSKVVR